MKFIIDRMLGTLATWLRIVGYDTTYMSEEQAETLDTDEDEYLLRTASRQNRILITRDRLLAQKAHKQDIEAYYMKSTDMAEQLHQLHKSHNINLEPKTTRCSLCNAPLREAELDDAEVLAKQEYVPQYLTEEKQPVWICTECGQAYWKGSHWKNIHKQLREIQMEEDSYR